MKEDFAAAMAALRRSRGISQRKAAADLGISQAQLSHYENGAREPGLNSVCRACDYYGVTADYLLGRSSGAESRTSRELLHLRSQLNNFIREAQQLLEDMDA